MNHRQSRSLLHLVSKGIFENLHSNIQKGKSGGYRVIYYLKTDQGIILTTIYSKSDISDVSNETIEEAIAQYEQEIQIADNSDA